ncbi:uncharacterized protein KY384_003304 [Bacidia gigantensis]|uniref:uncharacterized protein n=1 Tax=Bacidia gigantensis TaxID=2732470 RepID=UPI001D051779|nr:uncharacterized protein KY384_003304 [Bacidia gigantensis]KAG8531672.1 hypothetical protein KY384_003304 [Bacidia gigantensis]
MRQIYRSGNLVGSHEAKERTSFFWHAEGPTDHRVEHNGSDFPSSSIKRTRRRFVNDYNDQSLAAGPPYQGFVQEGPMKEPSDGIQQLNHAARQTLPHNTWNDGLLEYSSLSPLNPSQHDPAVQKSKSRKRKAVAQSSTDIRGSGDDFFKDEDNDLDGHLSCSSYEDAALNKRRKVAQQSVKGQTRGPMHRTTKKTGRDFRPTVRRSKVFDSASNQVAFQLHGKFFLSGRIAYDEHHERDIIYKRNTFAVTDCSYKILTNPEGPVDECLYLELHGLRHRIASLALQIGEHREPANREKTGLQQFTSANRDTKRVPPPYRMTPYLQEDETEESVISAARSFPKSTGEAKAGVSGTCMWERVSLLFGTGNNGNRREKQTFSCVTISLIANLGDGREVEVASCSSDSFIVLARSPAGIKNKPQEKKSQKPKRGRPSAANGRSRRHANVITEEAENVDGYFGYNANDDGDNDRGVDVNDTAHNVAVGSTQQHHAAVSSTTGTVSSTSHQQGVMSGRPRYEAILTRGASAYEEPAPPYHDTQRPWKNPYHNYGFDAMVQQTSYPQPVGVSNGDSRFLTNDFSNLQNPLTSPDYFTDPGLTTGPTTISPATDLQNPDLNNFTTIFDPDETNAEPEQNIEYAIPPVMGLDSGFSDQFGARKAQTENQRDIPFPDELLLEVGVQDYSDLERERLLNFIDSIDSSPWGYR